MAGKTSAARSFLGNLVQVKLRELGVPAVFCHCCRLFAILMIASLFVLWACLIFLALSYLLKCLRGQEPQNVPHAPKS